MLTKKSQVNGAGSSQTIMRESSTNNTRAFARISRTAKQPNEHWTAELEEELLEAGWVRDESAAFVAQINSEMPRYIATLRETRVQ